LFDQKCVDKCW